jgi:hypothetical protein
MITVRLLPHTEWYRLAAIEPFKSAGIPAFDGHTIIHVAEEGGVIIGTTILHDAVQWHWNIEPSHQGHPLVFKQLFAAGIHALQQGGVPHVHTTIPDSLPIVQDMAERLSFTAAPGRLYCLAVPPILTEET